MATPRAVVEIADLIGQRGVRLLNILVDGAMKVTILSNDQYPPNFVHG